MLQIESLLQNLQASESSKEIISKVLSKLDPEVVSAWSEKIQIKNGKITGTFYSDLGTNLPFNDFVALYEALGYDFDKMALWRDWWCYGSAGCTSQPGYTCNTDVCP